jgi:hypothetical protein
MEKVAFRRSGAGRDLYGKKASEAHAATERSDSKEKISDPARYARGQSVRKSGLKMRG